MKKYAVLLLILSFFSVTPASQTSEIKKPVAPFTKTHLACAWAGVGTLWAGYNLISHYHAFKQKHPDATFSEYLAKLRRSITKHRGIIIKKATLFTLTAAASLGLHHYCYPKTKLAAPPQTPSNNETKKSDAGDPQIPDAEEVEEAEPENNPKNEVADDELPQPATIDETEEPDNEPAPEETPDPLPTTAPVATVETPAPTPAPAPRRAQPQPVHNPHSGRPTQLTQGLCELAASTFAQRKQQAAAALATANAKIAEAPQKRAALLKLINDAITTMNESRRARGINVVVDLMTDPEIDLVDEFLSYKGRNGGHEAGAPLPQKAAYEKYNCALQTDGDTPDTISRATSESRPLRTGLAQTQREARELQERIAAEEQKERTMRNHGSPFYVAHVKRLLQQPDYVSCGFYAAWFKNKFDTAASFADLAAGVDDRARTAFDAIFPQWKERIRTQRIDKSQVTDLIAGEPNRFLENEQVNLEQVLATTPFVKASQLILLSGHFVSLGVIQVPFGNQPHERVRVYVPLDSLSSASRYVPDAKFNKYIAEIEKNLFERNYAGIQGDATTPQHPLRLTEALERYGNRMAPEHKALLEDVSAHLDL